MNIAEAFVKTALAGADRTAIIEARSARQVTFSRLNARSDGYAAYFVNEGLKPLDIVILMVSPSIDFIALTIALFKIGATVVLIDPGMGYKNLLRCIERVEPKVLIGIPKAVVFAKVFEKPFRTVKKFFCCGWSCGLLGPDIRKKINGNAQAFPVYRPAPTDLAAIIFTTGSTGPPKGVRYEHHIFAAQLKLIRDYYGITAEDVDQPAFPLFALFSSAIGACVVVPDMDPTRPAGVDAAKFTHSISRYGVTYSFGSPAIWNVVGRFCVERGIQLTTIRKVLMAGAPVPYDLLRRVASSIAGSGEIHTPYGATESLPVTSIESREVLAETWRQSRNGKGTCVGQPLPGIELRIIQVVDTPVENLAEAEMIPIGEIGEIIVKGDNVTRGYHNNPAETKLAKIRDTHGFWHRMGDVGYIDNLGRLWFCGRKAHRVMTPAGTLYTIPCEAIANEHPQVYRSALVGVPCQQPDGDKKIPVLILEPVKGRKIELDKMVDEVRALTKMSPLTAGIEHFLIHPDFPVDIRHNAKIFREKLAIWAEKQLARK